LEEGPSYPFKIIRDLEPQEILSVQPMKTAGTDFDKQASPALFRWLITRGKLHKALNVPAASNAINLSNPLKADLTKLLGHTAPRAPKITPEEAKLISRRLHEIVEYAGRPEKMVAIGQSPLQAWLLPNSVRATSRSGAIWSKSQAIPVAAPGRATLPRVGSDSREGWLALEAPFSGFKNLEHFSLYPRLDAIMRRTKVFRANLPAGDVSRKTPVTQLVGRLEQLGPEKLYKLHRMVIRRSAKAQGVGFDPFSPVYGQAAQKALRNLKDLKIDVTGGVDPRLVADLTNRIQDAKKLFFKRDLPIGLGLGGISSGVLWGLGGDSSARVSTPSVSHADFVGDVSAPTSLSLTSGDTSDIDAHKAIPWAPLGLGAGALGLAIYASDRYRKKKRTKGNKALSTSPKNNPGS
jgi:hypothetical protein